MLMPIFIGVISVSWPFRRWSYFDVIAIITLVYADTGPIWDADNISDFSLKIIWGRHLPKASFRGCRLPSSITNKMPLGFLPFTPCHAAAWLDADVIGLAMLIDCCCFRCR